MIGECLPRLTAIGISYSDACELRRIAMTLHRWHELECGDGNDATSWCIVRGHWRNGAFKYDDNGDAYMERHYHRAADTKAHYHRVADRERGALKRLRKIISRYSDCWSYVQGDPRGASLYIGKHDPSTVGTSDATQYYTRGVAVYR